MPEKQVGSGRKDNIETSQVKISLESNKNRLDKARTKRARHEAVQQNQKSAHARQGKKQKF